MGYGLFMCVLNIKLGIRPELLNYPAIADQKASICKFCGLNMKD
jgi:hypothetical protein